MNLIALFVKTERLSNPDDALIKKVHEQTYHLGVDSLLAKKCKKEYWIDMPIN